MSLDLSCCHVARLMLPCRSTCHVAVSLDLSCCRVARLVMLPCRSTYVAVSLELSCCHVARLMLPCRSTCHVAMLTCLVSWLSWSCAAVLNVSCYRLLVSAVSDLALHQVPIEHAIQCLTYVIRRHDYTPSLSER